MQVTEQLRTKAPQKIVVVTTHAPGSRGWGGAVVSGSEMANIIADIFEHTTLICSDANNGLPPISKAEAQSRNRAKLKLYASRMGKKQGFGLSAIPLLWREIKMADGVYVSGVSTWPVTLAPAMCRVLRKPFIVSLHGGLLATHMREIRARKPLKRIFYKLVALPLLRRATLIRASSAFEARDALLELPGSEVVDVPNTFEVEKFPYSPDLPATQGTHLVFVGRLEQDKGIHSFLSAWITEAAPDDRISLLGSGVGEYAEKVLDLIRTDDRIRYLGEQPREAVFAQLAASHAIILPSGSEGTLRENFGNVIVEALAIGRPALVTRGLAWDALPAAGVGWLFDANEQGIRRTLREVLSSGALRNPAMPARCRAYALDHFSSRAVRHAVIGLVRRALARHASD